MDHPAVVVSSDHPFSLVHILFEAHIRLLTIWKEEREAHVVGVSNFRDTRRANRRSRSGNHNPPTKDTHLATPPSSSAGAIHCIPNPRIIKSKP